MDFKTTREINAFFAGWHDLPEAKRLQVIRDLKHKGSLTIVPKGTPLDKSFSCPMHGFTLARPCNLTSCHYYMGPEIVETKKRHKTELVESQAIASSAFKNCLIFCLDKSKNTRLSAQEVATVMGLSVSEVNGINNNAVAKIRRAKILEQIEKLQLPRFSYLNGFCVACEVYIETELDINTYPELTIESGKLGWCSHDCKEDKPKWQFNIERQFGCDYLNALAVGSMIHKSIDTLGLVFGVSNDVLKGMKQEIETRKLELMEDC